jgi:4-hydroxy-3-methylbut-2-en-1-yl diphosphate reductase
MPEPGTLVLDARGTPPVGRRQILLAAPRSFCAGVERAIDVVERAIERYGAPVYVRRQIVHNTHVVRALESKGAVFVEELDEVPDATVVVLAAHGVSPEVREEAEQRGLLAIDATCPLVAKVHREARRYADAGYDIVLIGHAEHEETVGTVGEAPAEIHVVDGVADVAALDLTGERPVAYLTQTTLATDETAQVVGALRDRFPRLEGPKSDDICYATQNRQDAVRLLAAESDVILVVGSRNSSNSNRLVEVAMRAGCPAYLVEDETELDPGWITGAAVIGLTAGASAPEEVVHRVVTAIGRLAPCDVVERHLVTESIRFSLPPEVR